MLIGVVYVLQHWEVAGSLRVERMVPASLHATDELSFEQVSLVYRPGQDQRQKCAFNEAMKDST